jgi:hypothetical protein
MIVPDAQQAVKRFHGAELLWRGAASVILAASASQHFYLRAFYTPHHVLNMLPCLSRICCRSTWIQVCNIVGGRGSQAANLRSFPLQKGIG